MRFPSSKPKRTVFPLQAIFMVLNFFVFFFLLCMYVVGMVLNTMLAFPLFPESIKKSVNKKMHLLLKFLSSLSDSKKKTSISRLSLMKLAVRNMKAKKTRTFVTIGGMMIGIGSIVFLVSIGYGLQEVVIQRVARLEEMKQADVFPQTGGKLKITDETMNQISDISGIDQVLPVISVVGRVDYEGSKADVAVYGVTTEYLEQSAVKPVYGELFESRTTTFDTSNLPIPTLSSVNGSTQREVRVSMDSGVWYRVREGASQDSKLLGYTKKTSDSFVGLYVPGDSYILEEGKTGTAWIQSTFPLWEKKPCEVDIDSDCEPGGYVVSRDGAEQNVQEGYLAEINLSSNELVASSENVAGVVLSAQDDGENSGEVLAENETTNSSELPSIEIASESAVLEVPATVSVPLSQDAQQSAVVNIAMLQVLGIDPAQALGSNFSVSFIVVGSLLPNPKEKLESVEDVYTIIGVIPDESTPYMYVPFLDIRELGVSNYSQLRVVAQSEDQLAFVRQQIEAVGFVTSSVVDTVQQISALFATARTILFFLGMGALGVAALGMFNTLTVSLLERTREVGLMKAMGMKSSEVKELFLTESMMMGVFGGLLGVVLGLGGANVVSAILSIYSISKGGGFLDIAYLPVSFMFAIILLSLFVGFFTGLYPSRRATRISALDALRYE